MIICDHVCRCVPPCYSGHAIRLEQGIVMKNESMRCSCWCHWTGNLHNSLPEPIKFILICKSYDIFQWPWFFNAIALAYWIWLIFVSLLFLTDNLLISLLLTIGSLSITVCLIYGTILVGYFSCFSSYSSHFQCFFWQELSCVLTMLK